MESDARVIPPLRNKQLTEETPIPASYRAWLDECLEKTDYPHGWRRLATCPACGSDRIEPSFDKWGCVYDACRACDLVFLNPIPNDGLFESIYNSGYARAYREFVEIPALRKHPDDTAPFSIPKEDLEKIIEAVMPGGTADSWVDVGGSLGWLAAHVRDEHGTSNVAIREIDAFAADFAMTEFGVPNLTGPVNREWDVVSCVMTLEHVPEPREFCKMVAGHVRPGGAVIFVVPHFSKMCRLVAKASNANAAPPFHLNLFSAESLTRMLERCLPEADVDTLELGAPAFDPVDVVDHSSFFDIRMPTAEAPSAETFMTDDYEPARQAAVNLLCEIRPRLSEWLIDVDGRATLAAICRFPS
jgi:SAM-dependent methyltransferase